jgi:hypothetical protein
MKDKAGKELHLNDKVVILHKKRGTTTPTLQVGKIKSFLNKAIAIVEVEGLNDSRNTSLTIVKLN